MKLTVDTHARHTLVSGSITVASVMPVDDMVTGLTSGEIAQRMAACWNACSGIPLQALQRGVKPFKDAFPVL